MTQTITIKNPNDPASPAQISFLESLIKDRECPAVAERYEFAKNFLKKGAASKLIDEAKAAPKKAVKPVAIVDDLSGQFNAMFAGEQKQIEITLTELPAFGYYEINGTFYYWDVTGKDVKPVLRRLSIVTNYDGTKKGSWSKVFGGSTAYANGEISAKAQQVTGTYTPYAGKGWNPAPTTAKVWVPGVLVAAVLGKTAPLSQAEAAAKGKAVGFCIRCGATLTDPVSVANGIGPVCAKYWS